jgi:hypothetical protein
MTDERHNASFMSKKKCLLGVNHTDESETYCRDSNRDQLGIETRLENRLGLKHGTFGPKIMQTFWGGESPSRSLLHGRHLTISVRVVPVELPLATRNRTRFRNL